ncbi:MAG: hypothetical protein K6F63_02095 [Lachnospiraceae bacterium]|nr:hypothetical protein [Lachnospiraceae bacterium]
MKLLTENALYAINGGDAEDYSFGQKIGHAAYEVYDTVRDAVVDAYNWVCEKIGK